MYGYGDDQNPYTESVDLLEDLVIEFITETTHRFVFIISFSNLLQILPFFMVLLTRCLIVSEPWKSDALDVFK